MWGNRPKKRDVVEKPEYTIVHIGYYERQEKKCHNVVFEWGQFIIIIRQCLFFLCSSSSATKNADIARVKFPGTRLLCLQSNIKAMPKCQNGGFLTGVSCKCRNRYFPNGNLWPKFSEQFDEWQSTKNTDRDFQNNLMIDNQPKRLLKFESPQPRSAHKSWFILLSWFACFLCRDQSKLWRRKTGAIPRRLYDASAPKYIVRHLKMDPVLDLIFSPKSRACILTHSEGDINSLHFYYQLADLALGNRSKLIGLFWEGVL